MPVYEYRCEKCGHVSSFVEKMFEPPRLFFGKKKCRKCGSRKLTKILSAVSGHVQRTQTEMMNELKGMGNVNFVPNYQRPTGPPGGVCPYEAGEKAQQEKATKEKAEADKKAREPIIVRP
jgi:putative FmdB family regulatory protein